MLLRSAVDIVMKLNDVDKTSITDITDVKIKGQMGAQLQNVLSQVELNKATAKKTEAEAEKIAGADTKVAEREAEMLESQANSTDELPDYKTV